MYLPWIGYFGMIDTVDVFVFYDDVQFVERSWQRRNKIKVPNGSWVWLSVPVVQTFGQKINEVRTSDHIDWRQKHWTTIKHAYNRAPFYKEYARFLESVYERGWDYLVDLNIELVKSLSIALGITKTSFIRSSELNVDGQKTTRLINVLKKIGASEYVSGPAARDYIETEQFKRESIDLYWYEFSHPRYPQLYGDFVSHLSVIDLLFNAGDKALSVIRQASERSLRSADSQVSA